VSFPFDLHSATVFDSHIPCRSHSVPLPCHEYAFLNATSQCHGRFVLSEAYDLRLLSEACQSQIVMRSMPISDCYQKHANLSLLSEACQSHIVIRSMRISDCYQKHANLRLLSEACQSQIVIRSMPISDAAGQCETKQSLTWTRRSLLFWCKDMSACVIYSTTIVITV
jgi:hypothetical protein